MPHALLIAHSYVRWLVLLAGLVAVARMMNGYTRQAVFGASDTTVARLYVGVVDLQVTLGIVLYAISPVTRGAMHDMAAAMRDPHVRFFVAEHPVAMILAAASAHAATAMARKSPSDRVKYLKSAIGYALSLGLLLAGIPWFRLGGQG
jgi:hypothetical protein